MALLWCAFAAEILGAPVAVRRAGALYTVDHWGTEEGLPNNEVIAITQTRDGYLWLGTLNGLVRFDGIHSEVFDENNTPGLNSSRILSLFEDSQGNLWIGSDRAGAAILKDGQVVNPLEYGSGGSERALTSICEDSHGAVWLYLANGDLWRYSIGHSPRPFLQSNRGLYEDPLHPLHALIAEPTGAVWVASDYRQSAIGPIAVDTSLELPVEQELGETNKLDFLLASQQRGYWRLAGGHIQKWTTNHLDHDWGAYPWNANMRISTACEDGQGNLLVGTLGEGVFWFDAEGKPTCLSTNDSLSNNYVLSLHVDREGSLWVGTDGGGLYRVRHQVFNVLKESQRLTVQSVCEDNQGGLWMGLNAVEADANGVGLWKDGVVQWFGSSQGLSNASVWSVFAAQNVSTLGTNIWAGTFRGLFQLQNGRFQRSIGREVFAIHQDRNNRLWLGVRGGLVRWDTREFFTPQSGLSGDEVRAIADDREGNLWVGTRGGGLNRRLRDGKFTAYHKNDGLPSEDVSSLLVDDEGVLWIGTGNGLARFHRGKWTRYTKREGLVSNNIGYLIEDDQGYFWIGSNAGLMRAPKKALNDFAQGLTSFIPFRAYGTADGLPTGECTVGSQPGACRTRDGKLWFPTISGLAWIDPAQLRPNTNPPPVVIESVLIDNQLQKTNGLRVGWPQSLTIPAGKERLEIHYTSLNLAAADRARFKYRLEGYETAWNDDFGIGQGAARVARYKLSSGHYRFQVKACNEDSVWNETGASLALIVQPPFWRTWWFLSSSVGALLGIIISMVHRLSTKRLQRQLGRMQQQEALEKERARIARDIHDQLGASLTQVTLLGEFVEADKDSPAEVEAHAKQICQTARDTTRVLDEIVWTVNPSNDTLDGLINYICKYAQEYLSVAGLRYRLDVPSNLPVKAIPPEMRHNVFLASKEAVTNVVRHAKASAALIRLKLEPAAFILEIEDNGRGVASLDEKAQLRNGLRNMRKRMEDIGGSFTIGPAAEGGTVVRLTAPL